MMLQEQYNGNILVFLVLLIALNPSIIINIGFRFVFCAALKIYNRTLFQLIKFDGSNGKCFWRWIILVHQQQKMNKYDE